MPKLRRVQAAQAYSRQPDIHSGYRINSGGSGTVRAMMKEQAILKAQASISTANRNGCECQSCLIQSQVFKKISIMSQSVVSGIRHSGFVTGGYFPHRIQFALVEMADVMGSFSGALVVCHHDQGFTQSLVQAFQ